MIGRFGGLGLLALTAACVNVAPADGGDAVCNADRAQSLVGRAGTTELGVEAQRLTGARGLRWIQPGQAVTMDFRPDRLNIELDAQNRITAIRCG